VSEVSARASVWLLLTGEDAVDADDGWLSAREASHLATLRHEKRARDWRLGRWAAKRAIVGALAARGDRVRPNEVEVIAAADGAPEACVDGRPAPFALSISHAHGRAIAALAPAGIALGCDLEAIEPRAEAFVRDVFTPSELRTIRDAGAVGFERDALVTLLWSAKESALKAVRTGLRDDTRWVEAALDAPARSGRWDHLTVLHLPDGRAFEGWATRDGGSVITVVADPAPGTPRFLARSEPPEPRNA
jgi:4'-phosphopantetheinyl transferase